MSTYLFRLHLCLYPIFLYSMFYNLRMEFGKCSIVCSLYAVYVSSISYIRCPLCYVLCSLFRICIAVYVDVILHICRCIYVCAYVDVLFLSTFRSFAVYVFVSVYVYPYVDVCFCMGVCIRMCICIRICFSTCICICVSSMYACLCARATTAWWQLVWEGAAERAPPEHCLCCLTGDVGILGDSSKSGAALRQNFPTQQPETAGLAASFFVVPLIEPAEVQ